MNREKLNVVQATGNCMYPALKSGDCFLVEKTPSQLKAGDLVLFGSKEEGFLLHRWLRNGKCKGDRSKQEDADLRLLGIAKARVKGNKTIPLKHPLLTPLQRIQAYLSERNQLGHPFHRCFSLGTYLVGFTMRFLEDKILS